MNNIKTHQLIELIYEAAVTPSKWTDLLKALAELVESVEKQSNLSNSKQSLLSTISDADSIDAKEAHASIAQTLKSITNISHRELENKNIDIADVNDLLMRHFARAIKIAKRLVDVDEQHNAVLSLLDRMPISLVLVDAKLQVIETNRLADEMLSSEGGLQITENILNLGDGNNERLLKAVEVMAKHDPAITRGQSLSITNEDTQKNIMLFLAPIRQHSSQQRASVAIFISQRKSLPLSLSKEFSNQYGLTNKELEVAEQLVRGLSVKDISNKSAVTQHTIRTQVKSVLKKTATSRQAELVSLVYNGMSDFTGSVSGTQFNAGNGLLNKTVPMTKEYKTLQLLDGRNLAYIEYGDPKGEPVFHCHSIFGSKLELAFDAHRIAQKKSVRLIVLDRPGYGASDPNPEASFINWSKDLVQLADHLNIGKFSLIGYVMGGMYALACAHEIPERINRIASISNGMMPESSSDYKEFIPFYRMNIRLAKYMPKAYGFISSILIKGAVSDPDSFIEQMSENLNKADRTLMDSLSFKHELITSLKEAFLQGGKACSHEMIQFTHDWSFKLSDIKIPVDVWHGKTDCHQPLILSERFVEHINDTTLYIKEDAGHYMFFTHWEEIVESLLNPK